MNIKKSYSSRVLCGSICICLSSLAFATPQYFFSGEWGVVMRTDGDTPTQTITPYAIEGHYFPNSYVPTANQNTYEYGVTGGIAQTLTSRLAMLWGLSVYSTGGITNQGLVYFNNETAPSYSYSYDIYNQRLMASAQLQYAITSRWLPFISLGIGCSRLTVDHTTYQRMPDTQLSTDYPQFNPRSSEHIAYEGGAGVNYRWDANWVSGLEYSRTSLGSVTFAPSYDQQNLQTLYTGSVFVNRYDVSLRYEF